MNATEENNVMKNQYWAKIGIGIFGCITRLVSSEMTVAQNNQSFDFRRTSVGLLVVGLTCCGQGIPICNKIAL